MCTYLTERIGAAGSGKGAGGWFRLNEISVYLDHPVHAPDDHTLNIDFLNPADGPSARVAVTVRSAVEIISLCMTESLKPRSLNNFDGAFLASPL